MLERMDSASRKHIIHFFLFLRYMNSQQFVSPMCKLLALFVVLLFQRDVVFGESLNHASLFAYSGYLTVPNAYTEDGTWGFHYTYLPKEIAPFHKKQSDNWVFSSTLGFLPFIEVFFSVYVSPDVNISRSIPNYGADKARSPGIKIRVLQEKGTLPAIAVGVFDPYIGRASWSTISSFFVVTSKRLYRERVSLSLGYGLDALKKKYSRLNGLWGGCGIRVNKYFDILGDYDGEMWSGGLGLHWKGFDANVASIQGRSSAFRVGYKFDLEK